MSDAILEPVAAELKRLRGVESAAQWLVRTILLPKNSATTVAQLRAGLAHEVGVILPVIPEGYAAPPAPAPAGVTELRDAWIDGACWAAGDDDELTVADIEQAAEEKFGPVLPAPREPEICVLQAESITHPTPTEAMVDAALAAFTPNAGYIPTRDRMRDTLAAALRAGVGA